MGYLDAEEDFSVGIQDYQRQKDGHTTCRASLLILAVVVRNLHCGRFAAFNGCTIHLESRDSGFDAISREGGCNDAGMGFSGILSHVSMLTFPWHLLLAVT